MTLPAKLIALIGSGAIAASAAAYYALPSPGSDAPGDASGRGTPPSESASVDGADQIVCVGTDRVLRAFFDGTCPAGHAELKLDDEDEPFCELCDPDDMDGDEEPRADAKLDDIERRIEKLEQNAYFVVVNEEDRVLFSVGPKLARLYNAGGSPVAGFGSPEDGGYFTGRSASGSGDASIAATGANAGVRLREVDLARVSLGVRDGRAGLLFDAPKGVIAGIGESRTGTGAMLAGTLLGDVKAAFTAGDGRGMASIHGLTERGGIAMAEARIGGGLLDLANARGDSAVKMGHNGNRYGIVLAGPVLGLPLIPRSGLPGSYFMGCQSGVRPACVPEIP